MIYQQMYKEKPPESKLHLLNTEVEKTTKQIKLKLFQGKLKGMIFI